MKPYSEDLRTRIVKALQEEGGMSKPEAARLFETSVSPQSNATHGSLVEGPLSNQEEGRRQAPEKVDQRLRRGSSKRTYTQKRPAATVSLRGAAFWSA